ncbi:MAG: asparaginase [Hyphomicrobiaceae bacterium]|nr:MAG: asparaginase [Hyphomicrobiaceae bacterium]KAB2851807.1 MAG: asparaginase [Hyphomicrobiaceae bacterium]
MRNPVLIELTRGPFMESVHAGAVALARPDGAPVCAVGDVTVPVFPRSAIKPLQALAFVESGAIEHFGLGSADIAIACGSHSGTHRHVAVVEGLLSRAGLTPAALGCGAHEPMDARAARDLARLGAHASPLHHNCSGKHAAMLATAAHLQEPADGYWRPDHPVQIRIRQILEAFAGVHLGPEVRGIDGCSVPNWAIPLSGLARAFARFVTGESASGARAEACWRICEACWSNAELVAGPGRLDTLVLERLRGVALIKAGAEGVYCGAFPRLGLGFALKIDDGAKRAAEAVAALVVAALYPAAADLGPQATLRNWRGLEVGRMRPSAGLAGLLAQITGLQRTSRKDSNQPD